ncbi:hypothetical protein ACW7G2_02025 [Luteimonas sp. A277]
MNKNKGFRQRAANTASKAKFHAMTAGAALVPLSGFAMAQDGFDETAIIAAITTYTAIAVTVIGAYVLGSWSLRAMGLLKRG